ncbi:DUF4265 domain-containing protein [Pseudoalteromonas piscicida]|uniref:DUF4265 domain-containing protein n=1 Tax=Pseudoalteromonas piscicida TaxID=43662 RepID=UPI0030A7E77F
MNDVRTKQLRFTFINHPTGRTEEYIVATAISDNIYQLNGAPFFAYGVNFGDQVIAELTAEGVLEVRQVLARSRYHSLRIRFTNESDSRKNIELLQELIVPGVDYKQINGESYALTVSPHRDYESLVDILYYYRELGLLQYELTGEPHNSFDGQ